MREVFEISDRSDISEDRSKNLLKMRGSVNLQMSSTTPGHLELNEEKMKRLICLQPIEEFYEVEDQPFARGKYATVRRCKDRSTGQQYAAKFLRKRRRSTDLRPEILHEVAVLEACSASTRIVRLHKVFESSNEMILLLELAPGGELQMLIDRDEVPEERQAKRLMRQILDGVVFLHSINIAHLDIKPQNLVLTDNLPEGEIKLCDLGISRYIKPGMDIRDILGTPDYVAPEVLNYEPISLATDMWSVGVILYVLLTGYSPFGGDTKQETFCNISQCRLDFPDDLFEDISEDAKDLMRKLMVKEPSKRLSAEECLHHTWFTACETIPSPLPSPPELPVSEVPSVAEEITAVESTEIICARISPIPTRKVEIIIKDKNSNEDKGSAMRLIPTIAYSSSTPKQPKSFENNNISSDYSSSDEIFDEDKAANLKTRSRNSAGMSSIRRNSFKIRMESLKQCYISQSNDDNINNNNTQAAKTAETNTCTSPNKIEKKVDNKIEAAVSVNKAISVQTMPINVYKCKSNYEERNITETKNVNVNILRNSNSSSAVYRCIDKDTYTFRRIIVNDSEDESLDIMPLHPVHISMNSIGSESSSGYSDNMSSSDSNSDTVSEMSIDSSSDRSSIISLDDSVMEYNYAKVNGRPYPRISHSVSYLSVRDVWERGQVSANMSAMREKEVCREECKETFTKALTVFSKDCSESESMKERRSLDANIFGTSKRQAPKYAHTSALNHVLISSRCNKSLSPVKKLDVLREQNGNLVVIREAKPGKYATRFSEVKCESLQSRIKKLQVQGAKS